MKVEIQKHVQTFKPIVLTITIESQEEVKHLFELSKYDNSIPELVTIRCMGYTATNVGEQPIYQTSQQFLKSVYEALETHAK